MSITVLKPGPLTTVQDAGRIGHGAQGYRLCGAADGYAFRAANLLAGNGDDTMAALELTIMGGTFRFEEDTLFALAGAEMPAALDGAALPFFAPCLAPAGSVLTLGAAGDGLRAYLAVYGGIDTPPVLGSRSTDLKCGLGGLDGRALRTGDLLPVGRSAGQARRRWEEICRRGAEKPLGENGRTVLRPWRFGGEQPLPLFRAVPGPQAGAFTAAGQAALVHGVYSLTADCDRMGCKLSGPVIEPKDGVDILSDGIVAGSVQISANGQPIVMLADHQTTGGYAKIATLCTVDVWAMAQMRPGQKLGFTYLTAGQAAEACRREAAKLQQIKERMA